MNIQLASDLHLEFLARDWPGERLIVPAAGAQVLVLAGDIANGAEAFRLFAALPGVKPGNIIFVAGNHEFYSHSLEPLRAEMREAAARTGIHFLDNERIDIGSVRFLGSTLWTDYRLSTDQSQSDQMAHAERALNDHRLIRSGNDRFTAQVALSEHEQSIAWLTAELNRPFAGKTVVVTHHGPHPLSVHPRYAGDALNAAFVSDLSALLPKADLWLHGHVHDSFDYRIGRCRVVANPAGYIRNRGAARSRAQFDFENPHFNNSLVINLESSPMPKEPR